MSFLVNLLHWDLTKERSDVIIVNACDVECLMFYTLPKFLSECILIRVETVRILIRYEYNRSQLIFI